MRPNAPDPETLTVEEVAERLGIFRTLTYELAATDRLPVPVLRLGRRLLVPRAALERVLAGDSRPHAANGQEARHA
jgi:excisionase family DNA binding protein